MKRIILLLAVLALLCGCAPKNGDLSQPTDNDGSTSNTNQIEQTEVSVPQTEATEPTEATTEPPETTEPTEPPVSELTVADWQLEEPKYLSYEEYFSVRREFLDGSSQGYSAKTWIKGNRKLNFVKEDAKFLVRCDETEEEYLVPTAEDYSDYYVAGSDGRCGYICNDRQCIRLNLETGKAEVVLDKEGLCNLILFDNLVLYYATYQNENFTIGRIYLPTLNKEILYQEQGEFYFIGLHTPKTNVDPIVWGLINPEYITFLKSELANPYSQFKKLTVNNGETVYDYSQFWECKFDDALTWIPPILKHEMQEVSGIRYSLRCTYDPATEELTKQTGIIDKCSYGSGYPHDHFNTEITTAPELEVILGQWVKHEGEIPFALRPNGTDAVRKKDCVLLTGPDSKEYLYVKTDGDYKQIVDAPVKLMVDTDACVLYITDDGKALMAVNYEGTQSVELYRAVHGEISVGSVGNASRSMIYTARKRAVILDGDTMIEISLFDGQYRELVRHPNLKHYYIDGDHKDGITYESDRIYMDVYIGMYYEGYTFDTITGHVKKGYRL